jgi:hypothetical protein
VFIRSKIIYGRKYAYLVKTKWDKKSKKVKQKVSKYLGSIQKFERIKNTDFLSYNEINYDHYIENKSIKDIVLDLAELELFRHGFIKIETPKYKKQRIMSNGVKQFDLMNLNEVLEINEGYMNKITLKEIERYDKVLDENEKRIPFKFAALFVNAGIDIDENMFIDLYKRFFSEKLKKDEEKNNNNNNDENQFNDFYY